MTESEPPKWQAGTPTEDEIRAYAYRLWVQNGHRNDRCAENWREARACLIASLSKEPSNTPLSPYLSPHSFPEPGRIDGLPATPDARAAMDLKSQ